MKLRITEDDIIKAQNGGHEHCPIACALVRRFHAKRAIVASSVAIVHSKAIRSYELDESAQLFVQEYDKNPKTVKPQTIQLTLM